MQVRFIFNTKNVPEPVFSFKICKYNEFTYLHKHGSGYVECAHKTDISSCVLCACLNVSVHIC
jgi:hypothetical protein